jgi:hypothetical protein
MQKNEYNIPERSQSQVERSLQRCMDSRMELNEALYCLESRIEIALSPEQTKGIDKDYGKGVPEDVQAVSRLSAQLIGEAEQIGHITAKIHSLISRLTL